MTVALATRAAQPLRRPVLFIGRFISSGAHLTILDKQHPTDHLTNVTSSIISKLPIRLHDRPDHPIGILRSLIESHWPSYKHLSAPSPLVTPWQNFDSLAFPLDHPGRSPSDSYYVNKDLMLRTHTSAHEVDVFAEGNARWLLTADVYRRDEIDRSHYPVFHQMEGACIWPAAPNTMKEVRDENERLASALAQANIVTEDCPHIAETNPHQLVHDPAHAELVAQNLKLSLNGLMLKLFGGAAGATKEDPLRVRWIEAYFPFTSPSYEVEVFFRGKWLEILGCGVVKQSTLDSANVPENIGWAFGLGLERIAMVLFSIPDIRLFWSQDPRFSSQFQAGQLSTFKPYSKYPSSWRDVSFWIPPGAVWQDNDFCDLVRDVAGDFVEDVKIVDRFTSPKTNKTSLCYRINYQSMDRQLSNNEINEIHEQVESRMTGQFGVEIR